MREQEAPEAVRQHDLAAVQVAGEDQVPAALFDVVERTREVAQQDPEGRIREVEPARAVAQPRPRVDAGKLDAHAAQLDVNRAVEEQRAARKLPKLDRLREGIAREGEVVV